MDEPKTPRQRAIEKVIALAMIVPENGCAPGEVANAETAAKRIILRWDLSLQEVEAAAAREAQRQQPQPVYPHPMYPQPHFGRAAPTGSGQAGTWRIYVTYL